MGTIRLVRGVIAVVGTAAVMQLLAACAAGPDAVSTGECVPMLRRDQTVYVESMRVQHQPASRIGRADDAVCEDVGKDARGPVFPPDPHQVDVWAFDGLDPTMALGVRQEDGSFQVFVAQTVTKADAATIRDALMGFIVQRSDTAASATTPRTAHPRWVCSVRQRSGFATDPVTPQPGVPLRKVASRHAAGRGDIEITDRRGHYATVTFRDRRGRIWQRYVYRRWDNGGWGVERGETCSLR